VTAQKTTLSAAARRTIRSLRRSGSLEEVDSLAVANVMFTARLLDELQPDTSPAQVASLTRAHLAACKALLGDEDGAVDAGLGAVIAALATPPSYPSPDEIG
jgi:hypothetical protein